MVPAVRESGLYQIYSSNGGNQSAYFDTTFVQTADDTKSRAVFKKSGRHNVLSEFSVAGGVRTVSAANAVIG